MGPEGPQGFRGPGGEQGAVGERGRVGIHGNPGPPGPPGEQGGEGIAGPEGREGLQGPVGEQGPTGPEGSYVGRWTIWFDTTPEETPICRDGTTELGDPIAPNAVWKTYGDYVWCTMFTAPYPAGTSQKFFEAGLNTGCLFPDLEHLGNSLLYSGPLTEARSGEAAPESRPDQAWLLLLLDATNRAGVMFEPDRIVLVVTQWPFRDRRDGLTVDDWRVHLTRIGPPNGP